MTLQEIKDRYAVSQHYRDWLHLIIQTVGPGNIRLIDYYTNEVMKIYARECLKLAGESVTLFEKESKDGIFTYMSHDVKNTRGEKTLKSFVDSESITNEKNIIL